MHYSSRQANDTSVKRSSKTVRVSRLWLTIYSSLYGTQQELRKLAYPAHSRQLSVLPDGPVSCTHPCQSEPCSGRSAAIDICVLKMTQGSQKRTEAASSLYLNIPPQPGQNTMKPLLPRTPSRSTQAHLSLSNTPPFTHLSDG